MAEKKIEVSLDSKEEAVKDEKETSSVCITHKEKDNKNNENGINENITTSSIETSNISEETVNNKTVSNTQNEEASDCLEILDKSFEVEADDDDESKEPDDILESDSVTKEKNEDNKTSKEEEKAEESVKEEKNSDIDAIASTEEEKLNEILKIVHEGLDIKDFQKPEKSIKLAKSEEKKEEKEEKDEKGEKEAKEDTTIIKENVKERETLKEVDVVKENVAKKVDSIDYTEHAKQDEKEEREETMENLEDQPEVGIVGPPTAVSDLINDAELQAESVLPAEEKVQDHVAEWVENTVKQESLNLTEQEEVEAEAEAEAETEDIQRPQEIQTNGLREKRSRKRKKSEAISPVIRKSQRIISNIIKRSIRCLNNKMHAMEGSAGNGKDQDNENQRADDEDPVTSPQVPQCQQNGAALPEETAAAAERLRATSMIKQEPVDRDEETAKTQSKSESRSQTRTPKEETVSRKRKSPSTNGNSASAAKRINLDQREKFISSLIGSEKISAEELSVRAEQLKAEVQALDDLARAKEMEWNEILSMRKLKEEAYLRIERRRQIIGYMSDNGPQTDALPPASLTLNVSWDRSSHARGNSTDSKDDVSQEIFRDSVVNKRDRSSKSASQNQKSSYKQATDRKQNESLSPENRQIGEGRQGTIVDVKSIIADYRLRHPETVPRRGRRMRNSINVSLGTGGAVMETGHNVDSRPSSTDSCKSNSNVQESNNSMSFKDVLVQFAKLSQQQGEPVKTPQNYPDVTLHPVAPSPAQQNTSQPSGSLLHGILTKSQSPRPTTFSPTLARLLTAPERDRNASTVTSIPQQSAATQHLLQAYQGSNPVSISDLLSSSKARTEITITPVVNTPIQSHNNSLIHVEDVEEETAVIEDRDTRIGRDNRNDGDNPPRCQGCHERAAQFVCAGCGNQWYCSRECQVAAWDEHSEVCSG